MERLRRRSKPKRIGRVPRRVTRVVVAIGLGAFNIVGCTKNSKPPVDTLVVALGSSPNTLDPRFATDAGGSRISSLLFSSLVKMGPDLSVIGDAAESWSYKNKVYEFRLRPGLVFSDGAPVTSQDIEFSFAEFRGAKSPFRSALKTIENVEVIDAKPGPIVKLRLSDFNATLLSSLSAVKFLPRKTVEAVGSDFSRALVGSGPFRFLSQTANEIRLEARIDHSHLKPKTKYLVFKVIRDENTRFLRAYKGEIDIAQSEIPALKVAPLEKKGDFNVYKYPGLSMTYILVNMTDPVLKEKRARVAISKALRRDEIITYKLEGLAQPATSILTPVNPFFNTSLPAPTHDPETAKAELRELGFVGRRLTLKTSNAQVAIENGKVLANQLRAAGLDVQLQSFEWGTFYGDIQKGNFQLATMKWVGSVDPDIYRSSLHSQETPENSGRNRGRYSNSRLDKLLEDGLKIADETKRIEHYKDVQRIVLDELPIIPLWYDSEVAIVHKRVKGYVPPRNGDFSALLHAYKE